MKNDALIIPLILLDQAVKLFIYQCEISSFPLISGILHFNPVHNTEMSWAGSLGIQLFSNYYFSIFFNIFILIFAVILYQYICRNIKEGCLIHTIFIFLISGIICSTIDRVFWKGSLDYLQFAGLFIFDLKDCYIAVFEFLIIYSCIVYRKFWKNFSFKSFFNEMFSTFKF